MQLQDPMENKIKLKGNRKMKLIWIGWKERREWGLVPLEEIAENLTLWKWICFLPSVSLFISSALPMSWFLE